MRGLADYLVSAVKCNSIVVTAGLRGDFAAADGGIPINSASAVTRAALVDDDLTAIVHIELRVRAKLDSQLGLSISGIVALLQRNAVNSSRHNNVDLHNSGAVASGARVGENELAAVDLDISAGGVDESRSNLSAVRNGQGLAIGAQCARNSGDRADNRISVLDGAILTVSSKRELSIVSDQLSLASLISDVIQSRLLVSTK